MNFEDTVDELMGFLIATMETTTVTMVTTFQHILRDKEVLKRVMAEVMKYTEREFSFSIIMRDCIIFPRICARCLGFDSYLAYNSPIIK